MEKCLYLCTVKQKLLTIKNITIMKLVLVKRSCVVDIFYTKVEKVCEFNNYEDACEYLKNEEKKEKEKCLSTFLTTDKKKKYYKLDVDDLENNYNSYCLKVEIVF